MWNGSPVAMHAFASCARILAALGRDKYIRPSTDPAGAPPANWEESMSAPPPVAVRGSLIHRVKAILMQPTSEWQVIDGEPATVGSIYMGYIAPLALIPAICGAVRIARYSPGFGIRYAITFYVVHLISPFVLALIIDALAPNFGGQRSQIQALKVAAYAATPFWLAGVFQLIPALGILSLIGGLYGLYLLYLGLPMLMKSPQDRAMGYTVITILAEIVVWWVLIVFLAGLALGGAALGYGGYYR
jgi:hypothetical protein